MLIAPLAYPNTIFASATTRLRTRTRVRTRETSVYLEDAGIRNGPPPELHFADDVFLRHHSPMPAVRTVVPVIAHHKVIAYGNHLRSPVVVAAELGRHVVVFQRDIVHVDTSVDDADRVTFFGDDALDE